MKIQFNFICLFLMMTTIYAQNGVINVKSNQSVTCLNSSSIFPVIDFIVYPLPAKNNLMVDAPDQILTMELWDITGKKIKHWIPMQNRFGVSISELHNGVYFVKLKTANQVIQKTIVINQ